MSIPEMTDELGRYWRQPPDIRGAPMDDDTVLLTPSQFAGLSDYSATKPSGVYPGKAWKSAEFKRRGIGLVMTGRWFLCWYGEVEGRPDLCSNNRRLIEVVL